MPSHEQEADGTDEECLLDSVAVLEALGDGDLSGGIAADSKDQAENAGRLTG